MLYDADIMLAFIEEIAEYLPQLRQHLGKLAVSPKHKESLEEAYRLAHTIKGSAAMLELDDISAEGRVLEQALLPIVEKKAAFSPALATTLLGRVDNVERLLALVKAEVSGEAVAAPPAIAAPPPPPPSDLKPAAFVPPPPPPETLYAEPPPYHSPIAYYDAPSVPPAPKSAPLPPPREPSVPPAAFQNGFGERSAFATPPPPPPPPSYLYNFKEQDEDDEDNSGLTFAPPPPPPPELYRQAGLEGRKSPTAPLPAEPLEPVESLDFDFEMDLAKLDQFHGLDIDEMEAIAAPPPPPPPPPTTFAEYMRRGQTAPLSPPPADLRMGQTASLSRWPVEQPSARLDSTPIPSPITPFDLGPEPAPFAFEESVAEIKPAPVEDYLTEKPLFAAPPMKPGIPPASGSRPPAPTDDLNLMDLLLEPSALSALEQDLFIPGTSPGLLDTSVVEPGLPLDFDRFEPDLGFVLPDFSPEPFLETPSIEPPLWKASPITESEKAPPVLHPADAFALDDILATGRVDQEISLLQNEILDELPPHLTEFASAPMPSEISVSDADLLSVISDDITNSKIPHLSGLDNGNALHGAVLGADAEITFQPFGPLPAAEPGSEADHLHDFTAAADLLAEFEPDNQYGWDLKASEAIAGLPDFEEARLLEDDTPTVKAFRAELEALPLLEPSANLETAVEPFGDAETITPDFIPLDDVSTFKAAFPLPVEPELMFNEDFSLSDFEALADTLAAAGEDEEAARIVGLASLRGLPSLERRVEPENVNQVAAEALNQAYLLEGEDEEVLAAALTAQNQPLDLPEEYTAEELAEAGLDSDDIQMGAFFLAEGQPELEELQQLVDDFDQPGSAKVTDAERIKEICASLRKAAAMMDLNSVSRQLSVLENTAELVISGELGQNHQSGSIFHESLAELQSLLAPFQEAAANLFALPETAQEEDSAEEIEAAEPSDAPFEMEAEEPERAAFAVESSPAVVKLSTPMPIVTPASDLDPELAEIFATEAEEHIQNLDVRLAALERDPHNRELIREIRRTAHTLKGSAAMVGFGVISQTGHLMEDLLDRLYDGSIPVSENVVELLFVTFSAMDALVRGLSAGQPENPEILEALRPSYAALLSGEEEAASEESGGAIIFERKTTPARSSGPELHRVDEAAIEALEAALAAAEAEPEADDDSGGAVEVARPTFQPLAPVAARPTSMPVPAVSLDNELSVKIGIKRLDTMMNQIGEMVINRTVLEQRNQILTRTVDELLLSIKRLQRVTRELETSYEVELLKNSAVPVGAAGLATVEPAIENGNGSRHSYETELSSRDARLQEFDTLEMDRYTEFHTMSREMTETVDDLAAAWRELDNLKGDLENAVLQQARLTDDLQDRVVKVRLVPVSNLTPRLYRTVRTIAAGQQKEIEFVVSGEHTQIDKTIFEELGDPLLHLVRNAVDHGIEKPEVREAAGKPRTATITFSTRNEGSQVVIEVRDDGRGINLESVRQRGIERGMLAADTEVSDEELYDLLFVPGFSTSQSITDISGRGVGLDVVRANIARLKGTVEVSSEPGRGTTFFIRLPSTLAITRALLVKVGGYTYAVPLSSIERTVRTERAAVEDYSERSYYRLDGETLPLLDLGQLLHLHPHQRRSTEEEEDDSARSQFSIQRERPLLVINGPERAVLRVDSLVGQQEVVAKSLGTHLKSVPGVTGATILGTGEVILILNPYELVAGAVGRRGRYSTSARPSSSAAQTAALPRRRTTAPLSTEAPRRRTPLIQVVDDSLSVRKVLSAALEKAGFRVRTSKDGQEALEMVQQVPPDLLVMDIEMPRMDGYELTALLKSRETFRHIPIVMLTSRAGLKHRLKAEEVGADGFLVKPYREEELLQIVSALLVRARS